MNLLIGGGKGLGHKSGITFQAAKLTKPSVVLEGYASKLGLDLAFSGWLDRVCVFLFPHNFFGLATPALARV